MSACLERGLPIHKKTQCKVGCHIFVWTGPAPKNLTCDCGLLEYAETEQEDTE